MIDDRYACETKPPEVLTGARELQAKLCREIGLEAVSAALDLRDDPRSQATFDEIADRVQSMRSIAA